MYKDKIYKFDAFCSHLDEIESIPSDSNILSTNEHSKVQALSFKFNKISFFLSYFIICYSWFSPTIFSFFGNHPWLGLAFVSIGVGVFLLAFD